MNLPSIDELKTIYDHLQDDMSQKIYRLRLLYSLLGEQNEISEMIYECLPYGDKLRADKICYYGAGEGCRFALDFYSKDVPFVIDTFQSGSFKGVPIISFDDFLKREDCRDYTILITVGKEEAQKEIKAALNSHGLNYAFVFCDNQTNPQYFEPLAPQDSLSGDEYFVDAGALNGETTKNFFNRLSTGGDTPMCWNRIPGSLAS